MGEVLAALAADYDAFAARLRTTLAGDGSEWTPDLGDVVASRIDQAGEGVAAASAGEWSLFEAVVDAAAADWLDRGGDVVSWVMMVEQAMRPALYPTAVAAATDEPEALLRALGGVDALASWVTGAVAHHRQARTAEVERDALFLRSVVEDLPQMVFVKDALDLSFVRVNRACEEILGFGREELLGRHDHDVFPTEEADFFTRKDRDVLSGGRPIDIPEEPVQTPHRGLRWLHTRKVPIVDDSGRPRYLLGISEDITEAKRVQAELERARRAAEDANAAKSEFLARMSHELRTPLNCIVGMTELLRESEADPERREHLGLVLSSAETLLALLNEVLDFSKVEAGKLTLEAVDFDLRGLLEEVVATFAPRTREKGVELRLDVERSVPAWVRGDRLRIRQVLSNLLDNAVRFTETGEVRVRVARRGAEADEHLLAVEVADTGVGIPPDKQDVVFRAFDQADGSVSRQYGGSGLGLTIASRLVELMGGRIELESAPGRGSAFRFEVRLRSGTEGPASPPTPAPEAVSRMRVLVAEDNPVNRTLIARLLEHLGHEVVVVAGGEEAVAVVERELERLDVVLMDVEMPGVDGLEATRRIRALGGRAVSLPILALTAHAGAADRERCRAAGMDAHVTKPIRKRRLVSALGRCAAPPA